MKEKEIEDLIAYLNDNKMSLRTAIKLAYALGYGQAILDHIKEVENKCQT